MSQLPAAPFVVRDATAEDMPAIAALYSHYVLHSTASFEETPPGAAEMRTRFDAVRARGLPWLAADCQGRIVGYCYAGPHRMRPAFRYTLENSIYVAYDEAGRGIGHALLSALLERCAQGPWRQIVAVIGDSANRGSIALHKGLGFHVVGTQHAVGFKFGRWVDIVLMQRAIGDGNHSAP